MKEFWMSSILLATVVILASAAVNTDYDHAADFSRYKTYSWLKVEAENSLWQDRIRKAVDAELSAKGWQNVATGGAAALAAVGSVKTEQQLDTFYNGFGGDWYWRGFGDGIVTTTVEHIPVGSLVLDIFDAKTKKLLWRARGEKVLSGDPEKNEKKLHDIVGDMFKKFPPMSKG
jgi:hypothetical protein